MYENKLYLPLHFGHLESVSERENVTFGAKKSDLTLGRFFMN